MKRHPPIPSSLLVAALLTSAACDREAEVQTQAAAEAEVVADAEVKAEVVADAEVKADFAIKADDFKIEVVGAAIEAGEVASAAELEVLINDEAAGINRIDVDLDGTIDHVQVVEVRAPRVAGAVEVEAEVEVAAPTVVAEVRAPKIEAEAAVDVDAAVDAEVDAEVAVGAAAFASADVAFEFRVIPSSRATLDAGVTFASTAFVHHSARAEVEVRTSFAAVVPQPEVHVHAFVAPVKIHAGIFVGGPALIAWALTPTRPVYVGHYDVDGEGRWIPPGHLKHGHWKATGGGPPGHGGVVGHGKVKGKGSAGVSVGGGGKAHASVGSSKGGPKAGGSSKGSVGGKAHASVGGGKGGGGKSKPSASSGAPSGGSKGKSGGGSGGKSGGKGKGK